ncbi:MAG: S41 family peptidase [Phycisphaerae bacterium]|nr:S41 family peptidase [Phycisphaerae bacterium]
MSYVFQAAGGFVGGCVQENGVKNFGRMTWASLAVLWVALGIGCGSASGQTTSPAGESTALAVVDASPKSLRAGIDEILAGKVDEGIADVKRAHERSPDDVLAAAAERAVTAYHEVSAAAEAQRQAEYATTVLRIQRGMMSQDAVADLGDRRKALRTKIREMSVAYSRAVTSETFAEASEKTLPQLQETTLAKLAESRKALAEATAIIKELPEESTYSKTFIQLSESADASMEALEAVWKDATFETPAEQKETAVALMEAEEPLYDTLADLETVVADQPWKISLIQARVAKQIAAPADKMREQAWYVEMIGKVEARGEAAKELASRPWRSDTAPADTKCDACDTIVAQDGALLVKDGAVACSQACANKFDSTKWYDSLTAFAGLEDLEHDNTTFQERCKEVRSHVRVLRLYGGTPTTTTRPATAQVPESDEEEDDDTQISWKDMTEGIDLEMVKKAITRTSVDYVTIPDYRKMTLGALRSIRVLAETPQSANSFPKLADEKLRLEFIAAIDRLTENVREKDNVEYSALILNLNNVDRASQRTVGIEKAVLAMEFADGFLSELDPFSNMIWPFDLNDFKKSTQGKFFGVGIQITKDEGEPLRVVTPLRGSPAFEKGIKAGDLILTVDGTSTRKIKLDKLITMIMGPAGTKVTFEIERRGLLEPITVVVERREISIQTVKGWKIKSDGNYDFLIDEANKIAYVRLTQFSEDTSEDLRAMLDKMAKDGVRSLIMDLRYNPGGYLRSAVEVANEFINKGRIVSTAGQQTPNAQEINAREGGRFLEGDLVVLINEGSASAAEIVSGALKDYKRATIIGERTYGKGSVQNVIEINRDKAYLKLTTAYYYLPEGRRLHRETGSTQWGVDPDIRVSMTPKQLRRWLDIRRKTDLLLEDPGEELDNDLQNQYKADLPLNLAVMVLRLKQIQKAGE